jgi:hypothetical protein
MYIDCTCTDRAFLEIHVDEMLGLVEAAAPRWEEVYYVINFHTTADMDRCVGVSLPRCCSCCHGAAVMVLL